MSTYPNVMTLIESLTNELHRLPTSKLVKVAYFVSDLAPEIAKRQRKALADSYGCMDDEEGAKFEEAVLAPEVIELED
jgi:hypothetical protein